MNPDDFEEGDELDRAGEQYYVQRQLQGINEIGNLRVRKIRTVYLPEPEENDGPEN